MSTHHLDDDNLFLRCLHDGEIKMRRINNPGEAVATWVDRGLVRTKSDTVKIYDVVISGSKLRDLEADLKKYRMYVNRQGYCYVSIPYGIGTPHRVNDFFHWSKYGVVPKITTIWNRCEMNTNAVVIDYEKKEKEFARMKLRLKEMESDVADMKLQLKEKDRTIRHLNDALDLKTHSSIKK